MRIRAWFTWVMRRFGIERKHAGGNAFQDGFNVPAALFERDVGGAQFATGSFNLAAAGFQLLRHAIERAHQVADFVGSR